MPITDKQRREFYRPGTPNAADVSRRQRFDRINAFVQARHGWIVSIPAAFDITMECLEGSSLPDDLRDAGYDLEPAGEGERILPTAIVERFTQSADGTLGILTAGSTQVVTTVVHHAGIVPVLRFTFTM